MAELPSIWLNGKPANGIAMTDRGLQYGDGFFTTVLLLQGQLINWPAHQARLDESAQRLKFPALDWALLMDELKAFLSSQALSERQVLKIIITRGQGGVGYQMPEWAEPSRILYCLPFPQISNFLNENHQAWWFPLKKVKVCATRWGSNRQLAGLKHLNRLENVLARSELLDSDYGEGIMLDEQGIVVSGTQSNICWRQAGRWWTADLTHSGVAGTTLARLKQDYAIEVAKVTLEELLQAEALFFCNAVRGIQPVFQIEDQRFNTEAGQAMMLAWQAMLQEEVECLPN